MVLLGRIFKEGGGWSAHCEVIGVFTQGPTRKEAEENLAEAIEMTVENGLRAVITEVGEGVVLVDSAQPALLFAAVLRYQREVHKLTTAQVAKRLGAASVNAYAAYEQGRRQPTVTKVRELLAVVAPELTLTVAPRTLAKPSNRPLRVRRTKGNR